MAIFKDGGSDFFDRSQSDRKRHRELLKEAIKKNLGNIIAEESIIGQSKNKKIKIPIKGIKEYQFIYDKNSGGINTGNGQEQKGQVIGSDGVNRPSGQGIGQAGDQMGEDIFETEITLEKLVEYLFEDLSLPDMELKKIAQAESFRQFKSSGHKRKGIPLHLDKKKSLMEKQKRMQIAKRVGTDNNAVNEPLADDLQLDGRVPFREDDLRYRRAREAIRNHSSAVVICIMDISGSMDDTCKYLARSFYFLLYQFVCWKYEHVEVVFIAHSTEAKEVNEQEFFHRGESGGTHISSGYAKALEIIGERYNPSNWNIYAFHCSDGDNWRDDNAKAVALAKKMCSICKLFGYGEIVPGAFWNCSTIRWEYENHIESNNFAMVTIRKKEDIWPVFKKMLKKEPVPNS